MVKRLVAPLLAVSALLLLSSSAWAGSVQAHDQSPAGSGWRQVLSVQPGQTSGSATVQMQDSDCTLLLRSHPGHSRADCVNHYWAQLNRRASPTAQVGNMVLASFSCNVSVAGGMWNVFWYSDVTVYFCWSSTYVYPRGADCSNWAVSPGESLAITWCAGGSRGTTADGGDNVTIYPVTGGAIGAGQREWLSDTFAYGMYCWNAHC